MRRPRANEGIEEPLNLPGEEWREFPDQPSYEVSSLGRVRRKAYIVRGVGVKHGYRAVSVYSPAGPRQKRVAIHRAVAIAFHGDERELHVAHLNGSPSDNRADNLAWVTPQQNMAHKWAHGTQPHGEAHYKNRLTAEQVREIRRKAAAGMKPTAISRDYPVCRGTIRDILSGRSWKHLRD